MACTIRLFIALAMIAASVPLGICCAMESGSLGAGFTVTMMTLAGGAARLVALEWE